MIHIRLKPEFDADVVIAGAGPAGAATACHLAAAGRKVILLDQKNFPRDKICGDFVGPAALVELEQLGVTSSPEYKKSNVIGEAALYLDGEKLINQAMPRVDGLPSHGRVLPRVVLDKLVFDAAQNAGARVLENCRLSAYEEQAGVVTVSVSSGGGKRSLHTRLLIGADGSESTVARLMRGCRPLKDDRIIAVRAYFEGVKGSAHQADLYFSGDSFPGYYWLFPTGPGTANVGVGMVLETIPPTNDRLRDLLEELIKKDKSLRARLCDAKQTSSIVGWPLTTYNPRLPLVDDGVMLVGDAAGLINPLNGEGIQYALLSGRWAAAVALDCLGRDDLSRDALQTYANRVHQELNYDMALANMIVQLIRNRSLNPIWLYALRIITRRARRDPAYANIVGGILAGLIPASDAVSVKVIGGSIEQAAMSLAFQTFRSILRGPAGIAQLGLAGVRNSLEMSCNSCLHPVDFLKWSAGVSICGAELLSQVAGQMMKSRPVFPPRIRLSAKAP